MSEPSRGRPTTRVQVKIGLEQVLYLAATRWSFRDALLADRDAALREAGLVLSPDEAAVLAATDRDSLSTLIDAVQPQSRRARPLLQAVAMTFVTLATGTADLACEPTATKGIQPDWDAGLDRDAVMLVDGTGDEVPLEPDSGAVRGIVADVPEEAP